MYNSIKWSQRIFVTYDNILPYFILIEQVTIEKCVIYIVLEVKYDKIIVDKFTHWGDL